MLPSGKHPKYQDLPYFVAEKDKRDKKIVDYIAK